LDRVPRNRAARTQIEDVLDGKLPGDLDTLMAKEREQLTQQGNQHILEILQDEFKDVRFTVKVRVASKQKDMALFVDKLTNVFTTWSNLPPEAKADPVTIELMSQILEASGISPASLPKLIGSSFAPAQQSELPATA